MAGLATARLAIAGARPRGGPPPPANADTYTVSAPAPTRAPARLRQAITDANGHAGGDDIHFDIPLPASSHRAGNGCAEDHTAPSRSTATRSGRHPANTNAPDEGLNTVLKIEIDCTNGTARTACKIGADDVTIRGLAMANAGRAISSPPTS